jgi:hypothetical protein
MRKLLFPTGHIPIIASALLALRLLLLAYQSSEWKCFLSLFCCLLRSAGRTDSRQLLIASLSLSRTLLKRLVHASCFCFLFCFAWALCRRGQSPVSNDGSWCRSRRPPKKKTQRQNIRCSSTEWKKVVWEKRKWYIGQTLLYTVHSAKFKYTFIPFSPAEEKKTIGKRRGNRFGKRLRVGPRVCI